MHELDPLDVQLLKQLAKNGRMSHVDLASHVYLSPSAVARRQKSLEDSGIITGYSANVSSKALGFHATVLVHVALVEQPPLLVTHELVAAGRISIPEMRLLLTTDVN